MIDEPGSFQFTQNFSQAKKYNYKCFLKNSI